MFSLSLLTIIIVSLCYCSICTSLIDYVLKESTNSLHRHDYLQIKRASSESIHEVIIAIKQKNIQQLEEFLLDVSNMTSLNYGKHKTIEEIGELIENNESTHRVIQWLTNNDVKISKLSKFGEYITVTSTVSIFERLFNTIMYEYELRPTNKVTKNQKNQPILRAKSYSLPNYLLDDIYTIFRFINLPPRLSHNGNDKVISLEEYKRAFPNADTSSTNNYIIPKNLRSIYNIVGDGGGYSSQTIFGAIGQTFLPSDLTAFQSEYNVGKHKVDHYVGNIPSNRVCSSISTVYNCLEATLDLEYILSVANDVPTTYWYDDSTSSDFVNFITEVASSPSITNVYSISYGSYESDLALSELTSFNNEAIKLGAVGATILVSSGDDGVTGMGLSMLSKHFQSPLISYS